MEKVLVAALNQITTNNPQGITFNPTLPTKQLSDFVSQYTRQLLTALDIPQHFQTISPDVWDKENDYIVGQRKVRSLKVIKDAAEWGVALIQECNGVLTIQEQQKLFLLQVIEKYRHDLPNHNKSTLTAAATKSSLETTYGGNN